ncbi:MAG: dienelactone hydrolase family protein [Bacteroidetes bacterium]|nr:dienelactone hydrolase family protein [Bacteroidota bacterium]
MHTNKYITSGKPLSETGKALILLHGRGGSAEDILGLADALPVGDFTLFALQAAGHSWYPYSFLSVPAQNEPWLSSALGVVRELVEEIKAQGIAEEKIWFTGFSQGACLTLEFVTRNAARYGGVAAFTGGLIGDRIYAENYKGDFGGTPVFIGTSDPDPHVPVQRVHDSVGVLRERGAVVTEKVYKGMGHTITGQEIEDAKASVFYTSYSAPY